MNEDDPVIKQMRNRIKVLKAEIASHERNRGLYQGVVDSHVDALRKRHVEMEQTEQTIAALLDQDTVNLGVPRHIVIEALDQQGEE